MPKLKYNSNGRKLSDICTQDRELRKKHFQELTEAFRECVVHARPNLVLPSGTVIRKDKPEIVELGGLPVIVFPTENVNGERNGQQIHWTGV